MLSLTNTKEDDLPRITAWEREPENCKFILPNSIEEHLQFLQQSNNVHLKLVNEVLELKGYVMLSGLENEHKCIEFKRLLIAEKGKGWGRVAVRLVKKFAFEKLNAHRLWLDVFEENQRARHLYKSEGFAEEKVLQECIWKGDRYQNLVIMALLEESYRAQINRE